MAHPARSYAMTDTWLPARSQGTYQHLARQQGQLSMSDLREQETVRIASTKAPQPYWELSFVNEDGGRQTRLELTSGSYPSEHTLALARACAA
jgi:hypothetical protein